MYEIYYWKSKIREEQGNIKLNKIVFKKCKRYSSEWMEYKKWIKESIEEIKYCREEIAGIKKSKIKHSKLLDDLM